ncbi:MAG: HD domain-containing protein [Flavobacteriales bacterium]|jgi:predicted metal-dependent HD superfamily phosphohydrolase
MQFEAATSRILKILQESLPGKLCYHCFEHVEDVYRAAERLSDAEGVTETERQLLLTAVCYHDAGFMRGTDNHEQHSCDMVREDLGSFGYTPEDIEAICSMIMATRVPQDPRARLEEIICDADLDYLGRDDFFEVGDRLYRELLGAGRVTDQHEWNRIQVHFLENHRYFTRTAVNTRQPAKLRNLEMLRTLLP